MKTADPELMRAINRFHVMDAIRRFGLILRVEIAERADFSQTRVSAITATLIDNRLIWARGPAATTLRGLYRVPRNATGPACCQQPSA